MYTMPSEVSRPLTALPGNPTDEQRHEMLRAVLSRDGRIDDYDDIISLLNPPLDATHYANPGEFKGLKAGIIGGGLAGMSAAFELRKLGFDITVFEPNTEWIGGRVYTYYFDRDKKQYGELGAMRIPASHETTWHYINHFKIDTKPIFAENSNTFIFVRNVRVRNDPEGQNVLHNIYPLFDLTIMEANTPWPKLYDQVPKYYLSTLPPEVRKQILMTLPRYDYRFEALQKISIRKAMQQYGLSDEAINLITSIMPSLGGLIDNSFESELHSEYTIDYQNTYYIPGGMAKLPLAFYNCLNSPDPHEYPGIPQNALGKIEWKGGFAVTGIIRSDRNGKVTLRYRKSSVVEDIFEDFDYVVCTVPFPVIRGMDIYPDFSTGKMEAIKEVYYQDGQKTLFLCRERFWEKQGIFRGSSSTDTIIGMIGYPRDHEYCTQEGPNCSPDEPGVLLASYNLGEDAYSLGNFYPTTQYAVTTDKVERVHGLPRMYLDKNKIVLDSKVIDWVREPLFNGAFQFFLPGQKETFYYVSTTPEYDNRVFFAGEHTAHKNGWMQGALWSGMRAAQDVAYYSMIHKYQK